VEDFTMTPFARILTAAALAGALAAPAAAQYPYPQPQPYPQQTYPGYGYNNNGGVVGQVIDQLLGNRYNVTDRRAVSQCASAAVVQAQNQYRGGGYGQQGYGQRYNQPYGQGFAAPAFRVTAITDVQRRSSGLRVRGLIGTGYGGQRYGQGYANRGYATGELTFRCNVDYRGYVTNVRIGRNGENRRY
jgi:hypothetical protein